MTAVTAKPRILIVDDDENTRTTLSDLLLAKGYAPTAVATPNEALTAAEGVDLILLDICLEKSNGIDLIDGFKAKDPDVPIIMISGYGTVENAVEAMKRGAYDFARKPLDLAEFILRVRNAVDHRRLTGQVEALRSELTAAHGFGNIIGRSPAMRKVFDSMKRVATSDASVIISGESGTGKELVARAIHQASHRAKNPFFTINCSALPETLLESELFGHIKGAFTGAYRDKNGLFTEADKGTIFLDEIGEMPLTIQAKVLRVLQDGEVRPIGGTTVGKVDVRLISATNQNLEQRIAESRFRDDLYYRISVFPIRLPPLRERREDIPLLAQHFLAKHRNEARGGGPTAFAPAALQKLLAHDWPGNVRELENRIEQALVLATGRTIKPSDIMLETEGPSSSVRSFRDAKSEFEREYAIRVLTVAGGNVVRAAEMAGKHRTDFYYLMRKYKVKANTFRARPHRR